MDESRQQTLRQMDADAEVAKEEFMDLPEEIRSAMADFHAKHYAKAGHKRLGRFYVQYSKDQKKAAEAAEVK